MPLKVIAFDANGSMSSVNNCKVGRTLACVKMRCLRHDAKKGAQLKRMRL
jgi:hypothetical protein